MIWRGTQLVLHILLGIVLTPLVGRRDPGSGKRRSIPRVVSWWHARAARILHLHMRASGPPPQAPALLVANHVSWLDIVVLGALTNTGFLSKHEVREWPVIGWLAETSGTLFIKRGRGDARDIGSAIAGQLQKDRLLTLFPEGTTTDGRDVRPFFSRLFSAAIDSGTAVIPVAIRYHVNGEFDAVAPYIDDQTLVQNLAGLLQRRQSRVDVVFGDPIEVDGMTRKQLADRSRAFIRDHLPRVAEAPPAAT